MKKLLFLVILIVPVLLFSFPALASTALDTVMGSVTATGTSAGLNSEPQSFQDLLVGTINVVLGLLGIVALGFIVYAGILYASSMGEKDKVEKGRKTLTYAIIGMVLIIAAYAITNYLLSAIITFAG